MRPVDPCSLSSRHVFYFTLDNPLLLSHSPRLANPAICPSLSGSRGIPEACTRERKEWGREQENGEEKRQGETSVLIRKGCTFQDWNHQAGCVPWQTCFRLPLSCRSVWGCKRTRCVCVWEKAAEVASSIILIGRRPSLHWPTLMFTDVIFFSTSKAFLKFYKIHSPCTSTRRRCEEVLTKEVQEGVYINVCVIGVCQIYQGWTRCWALI